MIKLENFEVMGWEHAIRGMRNPMNSWEKSDSDYNIFLAHKCDECGKWDLPEEDSCDGCWVNNYIPPHTGFTIGPNDHDLMMRLSEAGPVHGKFRRMITVYVDITAPLYWWKEFDTYKVGTVANSCSTMHKIHAKEFTVEDFSCEHLFDDVEGIDTKDWYYDTLLHVIDSLNTARESYLASKEKRYWWQMIQLLPSSYNQRRTVQLNYEVLANIYTYRKNHKLDEWRTFCSWIEELPYSEIIIGDLEKGKENV